MVEKTKRENMIKMTIYFHTGSSGLSLPSKTAYKSGIVTLPVNHKHGIRSGLRTYFGGSQQDLMNAIKECLSKNNIKLVEESKASEYKKFLETQKKEEFFDKEYNL